MNQITIDDINYLYEAKQIAGDTLSLTKCVGKEDGILLAYCHGTEWTPERYRMVIWAFSNIHKHPFRLYVSAPMLVRDELRKYANHLETGNYIVFLESNENIAKFNNVLEIVIPIEQEHAFLVGSPVQIVRAEPLCIWRSVLSAMESNLYEI